MSSNTKEDGNTTSVNVNIEEDCPITLTNTETQYEKVTTPNLSEDVIVLPRPSPDNHHSTETPVVNNTENNNVEVHEDLMHGINSFWALVFPICITMIFASLVVTNYRNETLERSMGQYLVFSNSGNASNTTSKSKELLGSFGNALIIIGGIAIMTFGMALLYKYNCMKFLAGYIMFASAAILSYVGGQLVDSIINTQLQWVVNWPSFLFVMINFGIVGVIAIFYQKGIPKLIQNGYLVCVSVILAWQFSMWPAVTTIIFCFCFAVYDLCAVLTPCGPLKWLISLIQEKNQPLPGLLYEADVRDGVANEEQRQRARLAAETRRLEEQRSRHTPSNSVKSQQRQNISESTASARTASEPNRANSNEESRAPQQVNRQNMDEVSVTVPLKNDTSSSTRPRNVAESDFTTHQCDKIEDLTSLVEEFYRTFSPEDVWKAQQVAEKFYEDQDRLWLLIFHKYKVCSCSMNLPCPIRAQRIAERRAAREEEDDDKTIKLGLGDFIFYSVLVGRAAIYDFSTFAVTFLCIVMGLGGTLFLLSVLHQALPALPISIFLAIFFYLWTQYVFPEFCDFTMNAIALI